MAPLSILSVAAAAVQFLDFASGILINTKEAYQSSLGQVQDDVELSKVSQDFFSFTNNILSKLSDLKQVEGSQQPVYSASGVEKDTITTLFRLCCEAEDINREIQDTLRQLQARGVNKIKLATESFAISLKRVWSADKVQKLENRLDRNRKQVTMAMLVLSWGQAESNRVTMKQFAKNRTELIDQLHNIDESTRKYGQQILKLIRPQTEANSEWTPKLSMVTLAEMTEDKVTIKNSLLFKTINHREETVPIAYSDTYEWVFGKPRCAPDGSPLCEIYWISGKPGLLRTILHRYLENFSNLLIHKLFPTRWALVRLFSADTVVPLPDWKLWELRSAFRKLLTLADQGLNDAGVSFKIALIIDGLDEFDDDQDHTWLVELIQEAVTYRNVKICASSRPWNVFRDAFSSSPMLQLEKLTQNDIEHYVHGQFQGSPGFAEQQLLYPLQTEKLLSNIVQRAQGVFLWVSVVVRSLKISLQEGDKLSDAQATLDNLPEDLGRLFLAIWRRTSSMNKTEGAHYFLLVHVCQKYNLVPYSMTILWGDDDVSMDVGPGMAKEPFISCSISSLSRRLNSRTKGLLEIRDDANPWESQIDYMHRTVKEWITENWEVVQSAANPNFDAYLWIIKGETLRVSIGDIMCFDPSPSLFWYYTQALLSVAAMAESRRSNTALLVQILDKLDSTITKYMPQPGTPADRDIPEAGHWSIKLHNHKAWLPIRMFRAEGWEQYGFVQLMAQLPVPQYVQYKILENPSIAELGPTAVPLLTSAVIGGCQENPAAWHPRTLSISERLEFVKFVLQHVSLAEAQKTLLFMQDKVFFNRSWDSDFISVTKDMLKGRLRAEGLTVVESSSARDVSSEDTSLADPSQSKDSLRARDSLATPSLILAQKSTRGKKSLGKWARALFNRNMRERKN
ncbi:hypothetical protein F5Y19DRAFT_490763 [Xylariaceae sp. FL1651]|nr:hypothetical protein F5Y19DRAFT_490763 [Xylariaceae sp. FL1651]